MLFFFFLLMAFIFSSKWARAASASRRALRSSSTACRERRAELRSDRKVVTSSSSCHAFFFHSSMSDLTLLLCASRSPRASSRVAVSCFSACRCFSMVRMRASWSSTNWLLASSLLWCRDEGGEMLAGFAAAAILGSGGSGMAGGGEGSEAADELLRRLVEMEPEPRSMWPPSGEMGRVCACRR